MTSDYRDEPRTVLRPDEVLPLDPTGELEPLAGPMVAVRPPRDPVQTTTRTGYVFPWLSLILMMLGVGVVYLGLVLDVPFRLMLTISVAVMVCGPLLVASEISSQLKRRHVVFTRDQ